MKKIKKHNLYEVWNEYVAESILVDHKPTKSELIELCKKQNWDVNNLEWLLVEKYKHLYGK